MDNEERAPVPPLTAAYRIVRGVAPPETPVAGTLATCDERIVLLADAARLEGWPGWRHGGAEHVLAPEDLARTPDGHLVVLPLCSRRLDAWLATRLGRRESLAGGEIVTLVVSLLRGVQEAWSVRTDEMDEPRGVWWLTDDGRPMLALGEGDAVREQTVATIERVATVCDDRVLRRALEAALTALARPRGLRRSSGEVERRLFEACAPRSLAAPGAEPAGRAESAHDALRARGPHAPGEGAPRGRLATIAGLLERHVEGGLGQTLAGTLREWRPRGGRSAPDRRRPRTGDRRRPRAAGGAKTGSRRRAPLLVGAAAAALVLLGGGLWPDGDDGGDAADARAQDDGTRSAASREPETPELATPGATPTRVDPEGAAPEERRAAEEGAAGEGAAEEGGAESTDGETDESAESATLRLVEAGSDATAVLIDDFGDVVVTRIDEDGRSRHVLLARNGEGWRLRQVYETATG